MMKSQHRSCPWVSATLSDLFVDFAGCFKQIFPFLNRIFVFVCNKRREDISGHEIWCIAAET